MYAGQTSKLVEWFNGRITPGGIRACPCSQGDNTALHWAAMRGHVEVVQVLLQVSSTLFRLESLFEAAYDIAPT